MNTNETIVIMCAVRYALGRGSYAPSAVCDFIASKEKLIQPHDKAIIMRDIKEHYERYPDDPYRERWDEIIRLFKTPS